MLQSEGFCVVDETEGYLGGEAFAESLHFYIGSSAEISSATLLT
jgi:hypothetical protein